MNSVTNVFIPRCRCHRIPLSAGRNITLLIAGLNGYSCLSPYLAGCPRTFLAGATGDSRTLPEANRHADSTQWVMGKSFLICLRPVHVFIPTVDGTCRFW
ncbi:MAG: hypothetical protein IJ081_08155 [Prevotella sp.]|nr:hypothetical protein [Prevotella sp.]